MPSDSEVPTSTSPNTSSWIAQSKLPVSQTLNQPKNFYAQMSRLGQRLRKFTLVFLPHHTPSTFTSTPLTLVMLHALMTRTSTPRFLRARIKSAVLSVVKLIILIATLVPRVRIEGGLVSLHIRPPYRLPNLCCFMLRLPEQASPEFLKQVN